MNQDKEIAVLQEQMKEVKIKIDHLDTKLDEGFKGITILFKEERALLKEELDKKADKENSWAESVLRYIAYAVMGAIIAGLLALLGLNSRL